MVQYVALSKQYLILQGRMCTDYLLFIYSTGGYLVLICHTYLRKQQMNQCRLLYKTSFFTVSYLDIDMLKYNLAHLIRTILLDFPPLIYLFYVLYLQPIFTGYLLRTTGNEIKFIHQSLWYLIV